MSIVSSSSSTLLPIIDSNIYAREKVITVYEKKKPINLKVIVKEVPSMNKQNRKFDMYVFRMDRQKEIYHISLYNCSDPLAFNLKHIHQKRKMASKRDLPTMFDQMMDGSNLVIKAIFTPKIFDAIAKEGFLELSFRDLDGKRVVIPMHKLKKQSRRLFLENQELNKKVDSLKALISQKIEKITLLEAEKRQAAENEAQTVLSLQVELNELKTSMFMKENSSSQDLKDLDFSIE